MRFEPYPATKGIIIGLILVIPFWWIIWELLS